MKSLTKTLIASAIAATAILSTGCASKYNAEFTRTDDLKISYVARHMKAKENADELADKLRGTEDYIYDLGTANNVNMGVSAVTENTNIGTVAASVVVIAGWIMGDGSIPETSLGFISKDKGIKTPEEATKYLANKLETKINELGDITGAKVTCVAGCDSVENKLFLVQFPEGTPYKPERYEDLMIAFNIKGVHKTSEQDLLRYALDKPDIEWSTEEGHGLGLDLYGLIDGYDPNSYGDKIVRNDNGGYEPRSSVSFARVYRAPTSHKIAYHMMNQEGLIWGQERHFPYYISIEGEMYELFDSDFDTVVKEKMDRSEYMFKSVKN